jgi:hypothetical protein
MEISKHPLAGEWCAQEWLVGHLSKTKFSNTKFSPKQHQNGTKTAPKHLKSPPFSYQNARHDALSPLKPLKNGIFKALTRWRMVCARVARWPPKRIFKYKIFAKKKYSKTAPKQHQNTSNRHLFHIKMLATMRFHP